MRFRALFLTIVIVTIPLLTAGAGLEDTTSVAGVQSFETDSIGSLIFRMVLTLGAVIAIILVTVWLLRRLMTRRWPGKLKDRPVRVLDRIQLAPKRTLDVVAVGERVILLGVTENGINFLTELSAEEKNNLQPEASGQPGFRNSLHEAKVRMNQAFGQARSQMSAGVLPAGVPSKTA